MKNLTKPQNKTKAQRGFIQAQHSGSSSNPRSHPISQSPKTKFGKKKLNSLILLCSLMATLFLLWACTPDNHNKHDPKPPIPVVVAKIHKSDAPLYLNTIGTVTPLESVIVKTQVNGRLTAVLFQEGQHVQKEELLAQIDPLPYEAQFQQAEGQLLKDTAILENARLDLKRYKTLYQEDSISQQTLDTQKALVKQLEGIVQSDRGLVEGAKINLAYCKISSDIAGIIGLRQVNPGNYVQTTDAIQIGRQGPFIYVFNPQNNSVSVKSIIIKTSIGENSAISGDIQEGQAVIIQGQDKLTEDAIVKPTQENNQPAHVPVEHSAS